MVLRRIIGVLLTGAAVSLSGADSDREKQWIDSQLSKLKYEDEITYKTVDGEDLKLTLFFPEKKLSEKEALMVFTHGGGWHGGTRFNKILGRPNFETLKRINDAGIICASIDYRLLDKKHETVRLLDCLKDCKDAVRFLIANADKYGIDQKRIGTWGDSAGGQLCLSLALTPESALPGYRPSTEAPEAKYRCVVSYYPVTTFKNPEINVGTVFEKINFSRHFGVAWDKAPELASLLSPISQIRQDSPSILLIHGDKDKTVAFAHSEMMYEAGKKLGADIELLRVKNADHCFGGKDIEPSFEEINRIAAEYIIEKLTK